MMSNFIVVHLWVHPELNKYIKETYLSVEYKNLTNNLQLLWNSDRM